MDFNRCGVPLLEIVSEPELRSAEEAGAYLRKLRTLLQYLDICDGNMEEGSSAATPTSRSGGRGERARHQGRDQEHELLPQCRARHRARARASAEVLDEGGRSGAGDAPLGSGPRGDTADALQGVRARLPLLPRARSGAAASSATSGSRRCGRALPELPDARRQRFIAQYGLPLYDADVLTMRKDVADYYEEAVRQHPNPKALSNWVMGEVLRIIKERKLDTRLVIHDWPVAPERLAALVELIDSGEISGKIAKAVFEEMVNTGKTPVDIVAEQGLTQISDESSIVAAIDDVLAANAAKVAEYRGGKDKLFGFFVGQVMKATQGKANPQKLNELLKAKLSG